MELEELGTICDLQNGYAFKSKDYVEESSTVSLRMSNIRPNGSFDNNYNLRYLPDEFQERFSNYKVSDGDLVIAMTDLANNPKILGVPTVVKTGKFTWLLNQRAGKLVVKDNTKADKSYLGYILNHPIHRNYYKKFAGGGLQINVGKKEILGCKIPIPPLEIQKQIAQTLDNAATLRDKTQQLLAEYDQLAQSIFLDMFGDPVTNPKEWEKVNFDSLFKQGKKNIKPEDIEDGQKYIGLEHIEKTTGKIIEYVELKKGELKSNKFVFDENYVLYGKLRPYLNKVATPESNGICSTDIIPFKPIKNKSNRAFLTNLMRGEWFIEYANRRSSGANLPRISPKEINKYQTINPPIHLQNQFAEKIALIEQQKDLAKQELQESEDLFQALLQKAFQPTEKQNKGELV